MSGGMTGVHHGMAVSDFLDEPKRPLDEIYSTHPVSALSLFASLQACIIHAIVGLFCEMFLSKRTQKSRGESRFSNTTAEKKSVYGAVTCKKFRSSVRTRTNSSNGARAVTKLLAADAQHKPDNEEPPVHVGAGRLKSI